MRNKYLKKTPIDTAILFAILIIFSNCTKEISIAVQNKVKIGDTFQGGKVAYIYQVGDPGYDKNLLHGIIVTASEISTGISMACRIESSGNPGRGLLSYGCSDILGQGKNNTEKIVSICPDKNNAAYICNDLIIDGYSDWFLPSLVEMQKIWSNKDAVGGFLNTWYWTSSGYNLKSNISNLREASALNMSGGGWKKAGGDSDPKMLVRAARYF
jgi:hypothetical protein